MAASGRPARSGVRNHTIESPGDDGDDSGKPTVPGFHLRVTGTVDGADSAVEQARGALPVSVSSFLGTLTLVDHDLRTDNGLPRAEPAESVIAPACSGDPPIYNGRSAKRY